MADHRCTGRVELIGVPPGPEAGGWDLSCGRPAGHVGRHCTTARVYGAAATIAYLWWDDLAATPLAPTDNEGER